MINAFVDLPMPVTGKPFDEPTHVISNYDVVLWLSKTKAHSIWMHR